MRKEEAMALLKDSKTVAQWNDAIEKIKEAFGGLPVWWEEVKALSICSKRIVPQRTSAYTQADYDGGICC